MAYHLRFRGLCRGNGKIYLLVCASAGGAHASQAVTTSEPSIASAFVSASAAPLHVRARATHAKTQAMLPLSLIALSPLEAMNMGLRADECAHAWVCVLSIMRVDQRVDFELLDDCDTQLARAHKLIRPFFARMTSVVHGLSKNPYTRAIRNFDVRGHIPGARIDLIQAAPFSADSEHVRFFVSFETFSESTPTAPFDYIDLQLFNGDGRCICSDFQLLSSSAEPLSKEAGLYKVELIVGCKLAFEQELIIWSKLHLKLLPSSTQGSPETCSSRDEYASIVAFEPFYLSGVRDHYKSYTTSASAPASCAAYNDLQPAADTVSARVALEHALVASHEVCPRFLVLLWGSGAAVEDIAHTLSSLAQQSALLASVLVYTDTQTANACMQDDAYKSLSKQLSIELIHEEDLQPNELQGALAVLARTHETPWLINISAGDSLDPSACFAYSEAIQKHPHARALYVDEDLLSSAHTSSASAPAPASKTKPAPAAHAFERPYFKPAWDRYLILQTPYIEHGLCVHIDMVEKLKELPAYECLCALKDIPRAHVYPWLLGLYLQYSTRAPAPLDSPYAHLVYHIPRVYYHAKRLPYELSSRAIHSYTALVNNYLKACSPSLCLCEHTETASDTTQILTLTATGAAAAQPAPALVAEPVPAPAPAPAQQLVSIIIPTKDMLSVLKRCVDSIRTLTHYKRYEIILVENNSCEERTFAYYDAITKEDARVRVIKLEMHGQFNFSRVVNEGARHARGTRLIFLNNDTQVLDPYWIEQLLSIAEDPKVGVVGARLLFPDESLQHVGVVLGQNLWSPQHLYAGYSSKLSSYAHINAYTRTVSAVTGACMCVRKEVYELVRGFDETLPVNFNDTDFCLKLRARGFDCIQHNACVLLHHESISRGHADNGSRLTRLMFDFGVFWQRWQDMLAESDPFYSENFAFNNIFCALPKK